MPFDDDPFAGLHTVGDDVVRAHAIAEGDGSERDLVVVADDIDDIGALHLGDGLLRHQQRVFRYCGASRTRPNWPGLSTAFGFGNSATRLRVPVFRSTARSAMMMRPFSGKVEPSARINCRSPAASQFAFGPHPLKHQVLALADAHVNAHRIDVGDGREQRGVSLGQRGCRGRPGGCRRCR